MPNRAMTVKCPVCGVLPGYPCKTINGQQMPDSHTKRKHVAAKMLPLSENEGGESGNRETINGN